MLLKYQTAIFLCPFLPSLSFTTKATTATLLVFEFIKPVYHRVNKATGFSFLLSPRFKNGWRKPSVAVKVSVSKSKNFQLDPAYATGSRRSGLSTGLMWDLPLNRASSLPAVFWIACRRSTAHTLSKEKGVSQRSMYEMRLKGMGEYIPLGEDDLRLTIFRESGGKKKQYWFGSFVPLLNGEDWLSMTLTVKQVKAGSGWCTAKNWHNHWRNHGATTGTGIWPGFVQITMPLSHRGYSTVSFHSYSRFAASSALPVF